jgi:hypothetical protein
MFHAGFYIRRSQSVHEKGVQISLDRLGAKFVSF